MDIAAAKQALRFFRIYDTKLYNDIIEMMRIEQSFLESIYFSYDYSRNSHYCPKEVLSGLQQLRLDQGLQELQCYKSVPLEGNMEALAFPHRYLQVLLSEGIIAAKANENIIVIFKDSDFIFLSGIFDGESAEFYYFEDKKDRYALSKSLSISQIATVDIVFDTDFLSKFVHKSCTKNTKGKKKFDIIKFLKEILSRFKQAPAGA